MGADGARRRGECGGWARGGSSSEEGVRQGGKSEKQEEGRKKIIRRLALLVEGRGVNEWGSPMRGLGERAPYARVKEKH